MSSNKQRREKAMSTLEHEIKSRDRQEKTKPLGVIIASIVVILAIVGVIVFFATQDHSDTDTTADGDSTTTEAADTPEETQPAVLDGKRKEALPATVSCEYTESGADAGSKNPGMPPTSDVPTSGDVTVTFTTNNGPIDLKLDRGAAPCAVNSMVYLAQQGYYDDTICHRITTQGIKVLQCGDPTGTGRGGPGFSFADEYPVDELNGAPVTYPRGSVAMANSGPSTNGSQFFLNYGDSPLNASYTYFGTIGDEGMTTLDAIANKGAVGGAPDGKPAEEVKIESVKVTQ